MKYEKASSSSTSSISAEESPDDMQILSEEGSGYEKIDSSGFYNLSYYSFEDPQFSANIVIDQPNVSSVSTGMMESSQNFQTFDYPVFKKYGYYLNGIYYSMAKKGQTRLRHSCLVRRGEPQLKTITEEPEIKQEKPVVPLKKEKEKNINSG
uniref:Uncharacterized protein n=1 Tax=Caenorhabditis japonica TaxID=281687 RepID=A0A8R1DPF2_CAEJA